MHNSNLIHRDIKAANILVNDSGEIKLGFYFFFSKIYLKEK